MRWCEMRIGLHDSDMAAGIYKAVQEVTNISDEVKVKAAMKCMKLGFVPFMRHYEPEEG